MIIRHDLQMVFVHVPKCAGKEIRRVLKEGVAKKDLVELWDYEYNEKLCRYVDRAHLVTTDMRHYS